MLLAQLLCCCVFLLLCNVTILHLVTLNLWLQSAGLLDLLMTNTDTDRLERGGTGGGRESSSSLEDQASCFLKFV